MAYALHIVNNKHQYGPISNTTVKGKAVTLLT